MKLKGFLLNEEKSYLGRRVGDVLTSMQDLQDDMPNLGNRHLTKLAENIVGQIRKILHSRWTAKNSHYLEELQRVGVALQKAIEEKGDLKEILPMATQTLQDLSGKLGVKVNSFDGPEIEQGQPISQADFQLTGNGPQQAPPQPPQQAPQGGSTPMPMPQPQPAQPAGQNPLGLPM